MLDSIIGISVIAIALIGNWFAMGTKIAKLEGKMCIIIQMLSKKES